MTTGLIWILGLRVKSHQFHSFGVMNCIQYANITRQDFLVVENSADCIVA